MARTILDRDLHLWEAYASSGDSGFPDRSRMVFHCLSDRTRKARFVEREGAKAAVEKEIVTLPPDRLGEILSQARELK